MSDNPMYWPGHQRPTWHQQPVPGPPGQPPVGAIGHYSTSHMGPNPMLANPMAMSGDPSSLQMQSSIPGRHQGSSSSATAVAALSSQHPASTLPPTGAQSAMYPGSMMPPQTGGQSNRPAQQLTPNSHLNMSNTQGIPPPPHSSLTQQTTHPQSHYPHQYSPLASSYWTPPSMNTQSSLGGPTGSSGPPDPTQGSAPQPDGSYHASNASPLTMPTDNRGSITSNSAPTMQQTAPPFHSPKDLQSSNDHMMSYDRQRGAMTQQHPSTMMSQSLPSSTASNLSPTPGQLGVQGRLQSQSQLDSMRSMSQQSGWPSSYYQPNQSPYSSVMNPYMPYSSSSAVPNHNAPISQQNPRPTMGQKPSTNGSDRVRASGYPPHGAPIYGQPPPLPAGGSNGGYYGYDPYYNQMAGQATSDPYLQHPGSTNAAQQWPASASSNQMISNSSASGQTSIRPLTGPSSANIHPQSPSASTPLPTMSSRPPPQPQTPDRSPAPQHSNSYPSPNQQSASKPTSNSLAQLEQMVMPSGGQTTATSTKSPSHRSSTSSPSTNSQHQQQQLQYSYNSSGQGSYFSTGANASTNQASYYPQYESASGEIPKSNWTDQMSSSVMNSAGPQQGPVMENSQAPYNQPPYEGSSSYGEYATLSTPNNNQARFAMPGDSAESHQPDKGDPYAIDSQTFDDYDDQTPTSKTKKGRVKKGEEKVKRERKPRAPRGSKAGTSNAQPPPNASTSLQTLQIKPSPTLSQTPEMSPAPQHTPTNSFPSPNQQNTIALKPATDAALQVDPMAALSATSSLASKSPAHRLSTESPNANPQQTNTPIQYPYNPTGTSNYYNSSQSVPPTQSSYFPSYDATVDAASNAQITSTISPPALPTADPSQTSYRQSNFDSASSYSDYTPLTVPASTNEQPGFASTEPHDVPAKEAVVPPSIEIQDTEDTMEQTAASKSKKPRAKKADEKVKKERKPRAAKGAKSNAPGTRSTSPGSTTPVQGAAHDASATPSQQPSAYLSPSHQNLQPSQENDSTTGLAPVSNSSIPSKSPTHRLSTESPSLLTTQVQHQQPHAQASYPYQGPAQGQFYNGPGQSQTSYYQYDSAGTVQKSSWSDQIPGPITNSTHPQPGSTPMEGTRTTYGQPPYEGSSSYGNYTNLSTNTTSQPPYMESSETTDTLPPDENLLSAIDAKSSEAMPKQVTPKPKKSRSKKTEKSEEKTKKERKPRAAKSGASATTDKPLVSPEPVQPAILDESSEKPTSEPAVESTPNETKPKRIRIRDSSSKGKKKLPKFALKFAKTKKRKRLGSSDNDQSDLDKTPPPSPDEVESGVQKRRSARNTKKLKYNDDIELGFSESDDDTQILPKKKSATNMKADGDNSVAEDSIVVDEPTVYAAPVEDTMVVEKIMASRIGQRELEPEPGEVLPPDGTHIEVEEFYVKYKNLSYLHCDWRTAEELEKGDRRIVQKIKRYKQKKDSSNLFGFMDEDLFDLQYCEVDRILAVNEVEEMVPDDDEEINEAENANEENPPPKSGDRDNINPEGESKDEPKTESNECLAIQDSQSIKGDDLRKDEEGIKIEEINKEPEPEKAENPEVSNCDDLQLPNEKTEEKADEAQSTKVDESATVDTVVGTNESPEKTLESAQPREDNEEVQQTIEKKPKKMKKKISRHYLVKWRGLSYEESTWELEDDLDPEKIKHFMRFKDPPPKSKWKQVKRPKPDEWVRKEVSPVYKNNNTLREYQLEGINWLSFCWHQGRNCILADEMGLGKTIQSIAFVNEIYEHGINGPFLIIVPLSTVGNWAREFETWTDLNVITYHGSSTSREMLKEYEMFYRDEKGNRINSYYKFQVMITTFEIILSDCLDLRGIPWKCCIIDEAHRLKNRNCKLLEGLRLLNMEHRVLLTGTPLQNNVEELFSLLNFLEPTQFASTEQFLQEFGDLKTEAQVDKLKVILKPMMLRRLKEDVEKSLAPKEETIVEVELTNIQKKYYRAILEKNFSFLLKGSSNNNMPNLMNTMMELRKCCIHPYLINGAEEQIIYEARQAKLAGGEPLSSFQAMVNSSGKLVLIDKLLPRLRADGHRVLIFSQMVRCLDILEDYVTHKHYPFERIDGRVRGSERQQAIDRFSKPGSDRFVFLLCTRAGGLGINLTAADTVIIFDSDWNPQNDLQAQARCHRIGQSKAVKIYRLICRNTYEREMFDKASLKLGLDKAVLQSMNTQKGGAGGIDGQLTKKEIEELLRKGAYGALMDDDNAGDKFCEEDIDQILQRRTQVITIDNSEAKGSTFSKATFSSSNNREDIELDDPNFWEKWAKKANIDSDDLTNKDDLIQLAPRRRTQTKRYGADGHLLDISDLDSSEEDEETISMRTRGSRSGRQTKLTPTSVSKRGKRNKFMEYDDDDFLAGLDAGYWSKSDCLKVEKGLLTYGWGRWEEIIASNRYKRELNIEDCESICRVILLYCLQSYKGDEKIKSSVWELIGYPEDANKSQSDSDSGLPTRGRKPKSSLALTKKTVAEDIADAQWPKDAKNDPLIALPDDQYRRHLQRNCNRLLIRVKFLHYLKNDILKGYTEKILADCHANEVDLPSVPVDGEQPAPWWDDEADKSLLVGIFKHGHDKFNMMRQDPKLCFLQRCGPPNKDELQAEMNFNDKGVEDLDDENRDISQTCLKSKAPLRLMKGLDPHAGELLENLIEDIAKDHMVMKDEDTADVVDENENSIMKCPESQDSADDTCEINEASQTAKMDITDEESLTNETSAEVDTRGQQSLQEVNLNTNSHLVFPSANDLNQRFRRLITAYQRNSKKLEIKLAQKARDELKKERTSKFEAAKNEREERKRSLAQKWSRREEADFFRAISSFGVEYDPKLGKHDCNKFRSIGKSDKKLKETLEDYYNAFVGMCKRVTSRPLTDDEEKCSINVDTITEERASRCLSRIDFLNKIRQHIITHPELEERLKLCLPQPDLPDWWENGKHDKDLLLAAAKHGMTRLDYNLAHDPSLSFDAFIRQKSEQLFSQPVAPILIPLEQLQELLEKNGIEYLRDLGTHDRDDDDVKVVIEYLLSELESEEASLDDGYKSFADLVDGPHSKMVEEASEKSTSTPKTSAKTTRSSTYSGFGARTVPNILVRRGANTIVKAAESNPNGVRLTSVDTFSPTDDHRIVEIIPIMPDKIPEEPVKSFEAGELSLSIQSESALLQLDDRPPIVLLGATNLITVRIRWPKDRAIQTRLENLVYLVERNEWPSPPKPSIPTITLPNHLTSSAPTQSTPLAVSTSSPPKNDKSEMSMGSPKSDISNISSRASKQDIIEHSNEIGATRGRRGRGRRLRQPESTLHEPESPGENRQAAAKLRNLLSQGPTRGMNSPSSDKLTAKFGNNKTGAGLSSLLASFKQKTRAGSSDLGNSSRRDDKSLLDMNSPGSANLIPQILASMKPEFRDLLSNQDAATMLLNSLSGITGAGNVGSNLRSNSSAQASLENLLNVPRSTKGPPPAHQRSDNSQQAHGGSSTRELRRNSNNTRISSPPSVNLRSTRGKGTSSNIESSLQPKQVDIPMAKTGGRKRGRPTSSGSNSPPGVTGTDVLDLSSLVGNKSSASRPESRSRRLRDQSEDLQASHSRSGVSTKASAKVSSKQSNQDTTHQSEKGGRTTRASKRIGSRIDALALNLQAKRMNRGDSPTNLSPSLPKERSQDSPMVAHGSAKSSSDNKAQGVKAPPAAHSSSHKSNSSNASTDQQRDKTNPLPSSTASTKTTTSTPQRQDPLAQFMSNPASMLAGLNTSSMGGAGDLMNQLLRKAGTNDIVKNVLNEFIKNPSLALDPNLLGTLTASLPMATPGLPNFNLPTTNVTPTPAKTTSSSFLTDFKSPSSGGGSGSLAKRPRQDSTPSAPNRHSSSGSNALPNESRRSSSSSSDRHDRRSTSTDRKSSSYVDRPDKHSSKHEKRQGGGSQTESSDAASSRRSSSSLLAQQVTTSQQANLTQTSSQSTPNSSLTNASNFNLASQFGGVNNPLSNLLGFSNMNDLMKQMGSFPGLAGALPRVSGAPILPNPQPTSLPMSGEKVSRRSRQSNATSVAQTSTVSSQQAANAALANSLMNLASQPNAAANPYSNYANPLANPFLPFGLANLGMNNPLGMGLFPNLYMPGFPTTDPQQQPQQSSQSQNQSNNTSDSGSKDRKTRYPRK